MSRRKPAPVVEAEPVGLHLDPIQPPARKNRPKVGAKVRQMVYDRDGHKCVYCGTGEDLSIDHVQPLTNGGLNRKENMVTSCRPCNVAKADGKAPRRITRASRPRIQR